MEKIKEIADSSWKSVVTIYPSVSSFLSDLEDEKWKRNFENSEKHSVKRGDFEFYQTHSYDEALELQRGWEKGISVMKLESRPGEAPAENKSIQGYRVDVGDYLSSDPECMRTIQSAPAKKRIRFSFEICCSAYNSGESLLERGRIIFSAIQSLTKGYETSIDCTASFKNLRGGNSRAWIVRLKSFGQSYVKNNVAFTCHPSFFRRLMFRAEENTGYQTSGYGSVATLDDFQFAKPNEMYDVSIPGINTLSNEWLESFLKKEIGKFNSRK